MGDRSSAYAVLGLTPGADRRAVDEAYRRLIKEHHPDKKNGDPARAAEINRAYAMVRANPHISDASLKMRMRRPRRSGAFWLPLLLVGMALAATFWFLPQRKISNLDEPAAIPKAAPSSLDQESFRRVSAIDKEAVSSAVKQAVQFASTQSWDEANAYAEECRTDLARLASPRLLDHCVAFEHALQLLRGRRTDVLSRYGEPASSLLVTPIDGDDRIRAATLRAEDLLVKQAP